MSFFLYGPNAYALPQWAEERLAEYCIAVGIPPGTARITSTLRTAEDQARVMVENYTVDSASRLYTGSKGRAVIAAWAANPGNPVPAMAEEMRRVGFVSDHMRQDRVTVDIAPSSIPEYVNALVSYAESRKLHGEVSEALGPGQGDRAVHIALIPPDDLLGKAWEMAKAATHTDTSGEDVGENKFVPYAVGVAGALLLWFLAG